MFLSLINDESYKNLSELDEIVWLNAFIAGINQL
jgi:hypothetical protein